MDPFKTNHRGGEKLRRRLFVAATVCCLALIVFVLGAKKDSEEYDLYVSHMTEVPTDSGYHRLAGSSGTSTHKTLQEQDYQQQLGESRSDERKLQISSTASGQSPKPYYYQSSTQAHDQQGNDDEGINDFPLLDGARSVEILPIEVNAPSSADWLPPAETSVMPAQCMLSAETILGGSPVVGDNFIQMHVISGSDLPVIYMFFGSPSFGKNWVIHLLRPPGGFQTGKQYRWQLEKACTFLAEIPADKWDEIFLVNSYRDYPLVVNRIMIVHSSVVILNWNHIIRLDGSQDREHRIVGLAAKILETKLGQLPYSDSSWIPQIFYAAQELGKTDGAKYGSTDEWFGSDFVAWALRKGLWDVSPHGEIETKGIELYFDIYYKGSRLISVEDVLQGKYTPKPGDFVSFFLEFRQRNEVFVSAIFLGWYNPHAPLTYSSRMFTIQVFRGRVALVDDNTLGNVMHFGNTH